MSTKLCQEYLVKKFASWADEKYGPKNFDPNCEWRVDDALREEYAKLVKNAHKPSGWKRLSKFVVGSKADREGGSGERTGNCLVEDYPHLNGWTCRVFMLKGSEDELQIALFEKNGVIADEYIDYSD